MRIYMSFRVPAPSFAWAKSVTLLELLELGPVDRGDVPFAELEAGILRARARLAGGDVPLFVRGVAERHELGLMLTTLERAMVRAKAMGAVAFQWREDW